MNKAKHIRFGKYKLYIHNQKKFTNAYFNPLVKQLDNEYDELCLIISKKLSKDFRKQNKDGKKGAGKRVWGPLYDVDIRNLSLLSENYNLKFTEKLKEELSNILAEEVLDPEKYIEGSTKKVSVNIYERSVGARKKCIEHYGLTCSVCNFNFGKEFGKLGEGFIHVHHLKQLAHIGKEYKIDPIKDLRPICPNCHSMLHRKNPPLSIKELIQIKLEKQLL